jgi:dCMP deaminase
VKPVILPVGREQDRPDWHQYFMALAVVTAMRSCDPYIQVGAVVVRHDNSVAGLGYNGPPTGIEVDWSDRDARRDFMTHAEVNALRYSRPGEAKACYTTLSPCPGCLNSLAAHRVHRVYYLEEHETSWRPDIARKFNINCEKIRLKTTHERLRDNGVKVFATAVRRNPVFDGIFDKVDYLQG